MNGSRQALQDYGLAGQLMSAFTYVYVLVSEDGHHHYTGATRDLEERLATHNRGGCSATALHRPWRIETAITFRSKAKARAFER